MAVGAPIIHHETGKPVFNAFGLPMVCAAGAPPVDCCDECGNWLFCLRRAPYLLDLAGFDFSEWLPWISWSAYNQLQANQTAYFQNNESNAGEFAGKFIAEPRLGGLTHQRCPQVDREPCYVETGGNLDVSHKVAYTRNVYSPSAMDGVLKKTWLSVQTLCTEVEGVKQLKFIVWFHWEAERRYPVNFGAIEPTSGEGPPPPEYNPSYYCSSDGRDAIPYEPPTEAETFVDCAPILESDPIPLVDEFDEKLQWSDLANVELHPVAPLEVEWVGFLTERYVVSGYEIASGHLQWNRSLFFCKATTTLPEWLPIECCFNFDVGNTPPANGPRPVPNPDPDADGEIFVGCVSDGDLTGCAPGTIDYWCLPPAVIYEPGLGKYKLRVLAESCRKVGNCASCDVGEDGQAKPVEIGIIVSASNGCRKEVQVSYPTCLNVSDANIIWSNGQTGPVAQIDLLDPDPESLDPLLNRRGTVRVWLIDDRGCIYCASRLLGCGCCDNSYASLDITTAPDGCSTLICGTTSTEEGVCITPAPFVEVEWEAPGVDCSYAVPNEPLYDCEDLVADGLCAVVLSNGACHTINDPWTKLRWRAWDRPCGCAGEWHEQTRDFSGFWFTESPTIGTTQTGDFDIQPECDRVEYTVALTMRFPAWFCERRVALIVKFGTFVFDCFEGTIINPGDPPEDQIAEVVVTIPDVIYGPAANICWDMWFILGGCPDAFEGDVSGVFGGEWHSIIGQCDSYGNNSELATLGVDEWCRRYGGTP